ncbi:MAG: putative ABC transport system permease protein [Paraglaciecola sp.]|jgi:putative ABC transport system permease protein
MKHFISNLKFELLLAKSALTRAPGFSSTVIATLAVTLGALICIFSLNHLLFVKSLPYPDADNLVVLQQSYTEGGETHIGAQSAPGMILWYKQQNIFSELALQLDREVLVADHPEEPNSIVSYVTPEYFSLLKPAMYLGRTLSEDEGFDRHQAVTVLSYGTWTKWYNSDNNILGTKIMLGNVSYKVIGVTAESFNAPANRNNKAIEFWVPWDFQPLNVENFGIMTRGLTGLGKLKTNISPAQAVASLSSKLNEAYRENDASEPDSTAGAKLIPLKEIIIGDSKKIALMLLSGVVGLLLIATTNVTNLFLSRAAEKQRTMAIQAALGAKPSHLFLSMFAESLILCAIAGLLGLLVAGWGFVLLDELASTQLPRINELALDNVTLMFTLFTVITLAAVFAKLSSRMVNYNKLQSQLQSSGKGSGLQITTPIRNALIITQVTLATLLLVGASTVIEQALSTVLHPLGFNEENVTYLRIDKPKGYERWSDEKLIELNLLTLEIKQKLSERPEVKQVSRSLEPVIELGSFNMGLNDINDKRLGSFAANMVDHNYFNLLELPIVRGRTFTEQKDPKYFITEIILSESLARELVPDGDALGEIFQIQASQPLKVVGIAQDYYSPGTESEHKYRRYYLPYAVFSDLGFDIKLEDGASLSKETLLPLIHALNPKLKIREVTSHSEMHASLIYKHKLAAGLTLVLALLALVLAAAGIYGVLNYSTQMRRYELGIHLALGAKTHRLLNMVLKENIKPVLYGIGLSAIFSVILYLVIRQQFASSVEINILAIISTMPIMLMISFFACYLPVNRVIKQDPIKALRNE